MRLPCPRVPSSAWFAAALLAAPTLLAQAQPPRHLLRLNFEIGTPHFVRQTMSTRMATGDLVSMAMKAVIVTESRVEGVKDGRATMANTIRRLVFELQGPPRFAYDSDDPDSKPGVMKSMADLVGKTVRLTMDDRGRVTTVKLPDDYDGLRGLEALGGMDMEEVFAQGMPEFPDLPVAIGETWTTESEQWVGRFGTQKIKFVNRLVEVADGKAKVDLRVEYDTDGVALPGGGKVVIKCERSFGQSLISLATGQRLDVAMELVTSSGAGAPGMTMAVCNRVLPIDAEARRGTMPRVPALARSTQSKAPVVADLVLTIDHSGGDAAACADFAAGRDCAEHGHWRAVLTAIDGARLAEPLPAAKLDALILRAAVARTAPLPRKRPNGAWVPDPQLLIRADRGAPYGLVQRLLETAARTEVGRIAFAVRAEGGGDRERVLETPLPVDVAVAAGAEAAPEIRLLLRRDVAAGAVERRMGTRVLAAGAAGDRELAELLAASLSDWRRRDKMQVPGIVDADAAVPWQDVVRLIDAFRAAGVDDVQFASSHAAK